MEEGEALELGKGEFTLVRVLEEDVPLATIIKVGEDVQWPLTKDEPVVKLDSFHYLFSLPMKDGNPLSYGVTFSGQYDSRFMSSLDSFLKEHSCFSGATSSGDKHVDWKEYAPRIESYNNVLAKAIAGGTGQIVKGIFKCSNAYTSQVCFQVSTSTGILLLAIYQLTLRKHSLLKLKKPCIEHTMVSESKEKKELKSRFRKEEKPF